MKISCLIAIAILLITVFFIFKFLYEVFSIARNPNRYVQRISSKKISK